MRKLLLAFALVATAAWAADIEIGSDQFWSSKPFCGS